MEQTTTGTDAVELTLQLPVYGIVIGDAIEIYAGCAHSFSACRTKFANIANFGGSRTCHRRTTSASAPDWTRCHDPRSDHARNHRRQYIYYRLNEEQPPKPQDRLVTRRWRRVSSSLSSTGGSASGSR